jgi:hypothetical protein
MEFTQEQKTYADIVQRAWDDADFKKELTANPVRAIEKLTGRNLDIPAGKTLVVRDQTDESTVYINIPTKPEVNFELNENQLDMAAGGVWGGIDGGGCTYPPDRSPKNPIEEILKPLTTI